MHRFLRWYGASPLHLLTMIGCFALAGYAAAELLPVNPVGIILWLVAAVIGHDLILMPLYTLADRSAMAIFRHRPLTLPAGPWINYLRVPAVLSGLLLLVWFPLVFRLPDHFTASTTLPLSPYLWHWLAVTGALFLLSATALALRLGVAHRRARNEPETSLETAGPAADGTPAAGRAADGAPDHPAEPEPPDRPSPPPAGETPPPSPEAPPPEDAAPAGIILPDAELLDAHGAATTLYAAAGSGPSVLVFHQGDGFPDGDIAWSAYQEQLIPRLIERGVKLVAITTQEPDQSPAMGQKHELGFTVVSDPGHGVASRLSTLAATPPVPATVILDASHTVRWMDVRPDDGTRTEPEQIVAALDQLEHPEH